MAKIYTSYTGDNNFLIKEVSDLFLKDGYKVADVTYGRGVFWKSIDTSKYDFLPSDLQTCPDARYDFRKLPYKSDSLDVVVFDPPYVHNPGNFIMNDRYQNKETTKGMYHKDIINLYRQGMGEAMRVLKVGGTLWVKCKDEVESSIQRWSHVEILLTANRMGLYGLDLFVLTQQRLPILQHTKQNHARKNHSYLWVFLKLAKTDKRLMVQMNTIDEAYDMTGKSGKV